MILDVIVLLIILFFTFVGLRKGFWQYFLELLVIAVSVGVAWLYYQQSQEIFKSFFVFIVVSLVLMLCKWFAHTSGQKRYSPKSALTFFNRLLGAAIGATWGIFIAAMLILTIDLLPWETFFKYNIEHQTQASKTYQLIHQLIPIKKIKIIENISYLNKIRLDERARTKFMELPEVKELLEFNHLKAIMDDPETARQLHDRQLQALMTNPKIIDILNDGPFLEKLLKIDFKKATEE